MEEQKHYDLSEDLLKVYKVLIWIFVCFGLFLCFLLAIKLWSNPKLIDMSLDYLFTLSTVAFSVSIGVLYISDSIAVKKQSIRKTFRHQKNLEKAMAFCYFCFTTFFFLIADKQTIKGLHISMFVLLTNTLFDFYLITISAKDNFDFVTFLQLRSKKK